MNFEELFDNTHDANTDDTFRPKIIDHRGRVECFDFCVREKEKARFLRERTPYIFDFRRVKVCVDENGFLHNARGPSIEWITLPADFFYHGIKCSDEKELAQKAKQKIIFSAQKIKTIRKLLYIPEIYENVFYTNKSDFISLINKL